MSARAHTAARPEPAPGAGQFRAWAEISLANLRHNLAQLRTLLPAGGSVMAVVKADAYGHGAVAVAKCLQADGVASFAVAELNKAIALRKAGVRGEILILGYTPPASKNQLLRYRLTQSVISEDYARSLCASPGTVLAHVKLDTGMNRLGERCDELGKLAAIYRQKRLRITGTYSHLACADSLSEADAAFTRTQIARFFETVRQLELAGIDPGHTHIQNSGGLLNYPGLPCGYVRPGIALYGVLSGGEQTRTPLPLLPVLSLRAAVAMTKRVAAGDTVGYGHAWRADRDSVIALAGIGYADGIPRNLSGKDCRVLLNGQAVPIIGRVCMDQIILDVTGLPDVRQGDIVTVIGRDGERTLSVDQLSGLGETINNEILSRIGARVHKVYVR